MEKPYTKYLSKSRCVYAREKDPEESLIIRDEYVGTIFKVFGICGVDKIEAVFDVLWKMLYTHKEEFVKNCKYAKHQLLELTDNGFMLDNKREHTVGGVKIIVSNLGTRIGILNLENNDKIVCGVYLFPNEVLRLLYYMDARFTFEKLNNIVNHVNDNFF